MKGLGRSLYYWSQRAGFMLAFMFGMGMFVAVLNFTGNSDRPLEATLQTVLSYFIMTSVLFIGAGQLSAAQIYLGQTLSMGARRSTTFLGIQFMNLLIAVAGLLFVLLAVSINNRITDTIMSYSMLIRNFILQALAAGFIGEILFVLTSILGKKGFYIFVLICAIFGGSYGVIYSGREPGAAAVENLSELSLLGFTFSTAIVLSTEIILYLAGAALQYYHIKKYEVRV